MLGDHGIYFGMQFEAARIPLTVLARMIRLRVFKVTDLPISIPNMNAHVP